MSTQEWPANDYAVGSYIQATIAEKYLHTLAINPADTVVDLGCGNGAFTQKIMDMVPSGCVLGVDASENMLRLAESLKKQYPHFTTQKADAVTLELPSIYDYVVSFWCLQWVSNIHKAFENIAHALKPGGRVFALLPAGDDPYIMAYYALKKSGQFPCLDSFIPPVDYSRFDNLAKQLADLPFADLQVRLSKECITIPSLEVFRKFVNGIAFFQGQIADDDIKLINEAVVGYFDEECKRKYNGKYQLDFTIYLITGLKCPS